MQNSRNQWNAFDNIFLRIFLFLFLTLRVDIFIMNKYQIGIQWHMQNIVEICASVALRTTLFKNGR